MRSWWARQDRLTAAASGLVLALRPVARWLPTALPDRTVTREVQALVRDTDLLELYRSARCPLLVVNATADEDRPAMLRLIGKDGLTMLRAYRAGLQQDLDALAAQHPLVEVVRMDATHRLISTHAPQVAALVGSFLAG